MKRFSQIILLGVIFTLAACADKIVDGQTTAENSSKANVDQKITRTSPAPTVGKQSSSENSGKCQSGNADGEQAIAKPKSREEIDDWLKNTIGSVQVATLPDRQSVEQYYREGDFNADGCADIVLIVQGIKDKFDTISAENLNLETMTVQNLRSKAIYQNGETFSKAMAARIKPKQETALVVVFGNRRDWDWKYIAADKAFLLYDSVSKPAENSGYEASATLFSVIRKNKPEEDDDDLLYRFPTNAAGDCIYTAIQIKRRKFDFSELSDKFLICYDGKKFFNKKLPDSKSYPE